MLAYIIIFVLIIIILFILINQPKSDGSKDDKSNRSTTHNTTNTSQHNMILKKDKVEIQPDETPKAVDFQNVEKVNTDLSYEYNPSNNKSQIINTSNNNKAVKISGSYKSNDANDLILITDTDQPKNGNIPYDIKFKNKDASFNVDYNVKPKNALNFYTYNKTRNGSKISDLNIKINEKTV